MHKKMLEESKRVDLPYQVELPLGDQCLRPAGLAVVTTAAPEHISVLRWGLLPRYIRTEEEAKDFLKKAPTFNAISEEVEAKRTFKAAFEHGQRCLIPVTSFQEWRHEGKVEDTLRHPAEGRGHLLPGRLVGEGRSDGHLHRAHHAGQPADGAHPQHQAAPAGDHSTGTLRDLAEPRPEPRAGEVPVRTHC
ncbi:MAG: SOS response-associated peptidase family protein [Flavobacteriales bacterium]|nr:SOS response-associated peptidase family protein [Flavobacteriales bacterium]